MFDRALVRSSLPAAESVRVTRQTRAIFRSGFWFPRRLVIPSIFIFRAIAPKSVPVFAHNVKTDADVGATFHIEPDHNPQAGETARAWFALTRQGGELIPLAQCDCQLAVYDRTASETEPILTPPLQAIAAEEYREIPGADIVFPKAGAYELEISGSPQDGESFAPFSLSYSVTVTPGTTPVASPAAAANPSANTSDEAIPPSASSPPSSTPSSVQSWLVPAIIVAIVLIAGGFGWALKQVKSKES